MRHRWHRLRFIRGRRRLHRLPRRWRWHGLWFICGRWLPRRWRRRRLRFIHGRRRLSIHRLHRRWRWRRLLFICGRRRLLSTHRLPRRWLARMRMVNHAKQNLRGRGCITAQLACTPLVPEQTFSCPLRVSDECSQLQVLELLEVVAKTSPHWAQVCNQQNGSDELPPARLSDAFTCEFDGFRCGRHDRLLGQDGCRKFTGCTPMTH